MKMEKGTISIDFVHEALWVARQRGLDTDALLADSGLVPELLEMPQARVTPEQYGALWHALADAMNDEFFGMDAHPMRRGSFAILCHALIDCPTVGDAIERALGFCALVLDELSGQLRVSGGRAEVVLCVLTFLLLYPNTIAHSNRPRDIARTVLTSWLLALGKAIGRGVLELALSMFLAFFFFRVGLGSLKLLFLEGLFFGRGGALNLVQKRPFARVFGPTLFQGFGG